MDRYERENQFWDDVFGKDPLRFPKGKESGNEAFDRGLAWLTEGAETVLDFGCGSGTVLFLCFRHGTRRHIGIDLSSQAIEKAREKSRLAPGGEYTFLCGGTELLPQVDAASADAAVLSNILDNLYPEDALFVLDEVKRILKPGGRLLIKLNPFLTQEQIREYGLRQLDEDLFDDGLILWNKPTEVWDTLLSSRFALYQYEEIWYEEQQQSNRLYRVIKQ